MATSRCLVRGSINIDEVFQLPHIVRPGQTISATSLVRRVGGKGANQACAVAQAGGAVDIEGCVGPDGSWTADVLGKMCVGTGRITASQQPTGRAIIQVADDGENSIVLYRGANHEDTGFPAKSIALTGYTHVLLQNEIPLNVTCAFLRTAQSNAITTIFNPSPMLSQDEIRSFPWPALSWLIVNEGELSDLVSAITDAQSNAKDNIMQFAAAASLGHETGIICTLGASGVLYYHPQQTAGRVRSQPAAKLLRPLTDTTGAGDCFAGTFAACLMRGIPLDKSIAFCLAACAACVEGMGALESYVSLGEIEARMQHHS